MLRPVLLALYTALALAAIPAAAADPEGLRALRDGDMRKLVVHDQPRDAVDVVFTTADGVEHRLADLDGKIRIVNFWATWCAPCRHEKPALDALEQALGGADFEVVALATGRNSLDGIKRFNAEVGVTALETRLDPRSDAARLMGVLGLPASILLDREGREIGRLTGGADWTSDSARAIMERLIAETS
ncbi:MAG: TlpA disulfide reductase family protein [Pseudomonadota bacterium]